MRDGRFKVAVEADGRDCCKRQQEQIQAINNRLNATNASVEDVKKIGSTAKEPDDFRVYWKEGLNFDTKTKTLSLKLAAEFTRIGGGSRKIRK